MNRRHTLQTLTAIVCTVALAFTSTTDDIHSVSGAVYERKTGKRLQDVRIEALLDGVAVANHIRTDDQGRFEFQLVEGVYDLRAMAPRQRYVTGVFRNLIIGKGNLEDVQFELLPIDEDLILQGLDPRDFEDVDQDFVPDSLERSYRLDPEFADTDEDGIFDGVALWLGVGAKPDPRHDSAWLQSPIAALPLASPASSGSVPIPIVTQLIPGAVRYTVDVVPPGSDDILDRQEFDFENGDFLAGEGLALRWNPPYGMTEGTWRIEINGYAPKESDALTNGFGFDFQVEEREPEVVEFAVDGEISGLVHARSIHILEGVTLRVPKDKSLFLSSLDSIMIEKDAKIIGGEGTNIWMSARNWITSHGDVIAGDGADGKGISSERETDIEEGMGCPGGDLMLVAGGDVHLSRSAFIRSGTGGAGAAACPGVGLGGDGGRGGHFVLLSPLMSIADRAGLVRVGAGGPGGGGISAGLGGAAGDVWISNWDLAGDRYLQLIPEESRILGGEAGVNGQPEAAALEDAVARHSRFGVDHEPGTGRTGMRGWMQAGDGQSIIAIAGAGAGRGRGGHSTAIGGRGGRVARLGIGRNAFDLSFGFIARAGRGGFAVSTSGQGGGGDTGGSVGPAGQAEAEGGRGGYGHTIPLAMPSRAGDGGAADSFGALGRVGLDRCGNPPRKGGGGSSGGGASARGGDGGEASWLGGDGGQASATGGRGGNGGGGSPGGSGGRGGSVSARGGRRGNGSFGDGEAGEAGETRGERGNQGADC
ncbi:MAG: hypothetical protein ACI841_000363 [Planctomycetota bacterium]|jgi:hypothetical protein